MPSIANKIEPAWLSRRNNKSCVIHLPLFIHLIITNIDGVITDYTFISYIMSMYKIVYYPTQILSTRGLSITLMMRRLIGYLWARRLLADTLDSFPPFLLYAIFQHYTIFFYPWCCCHFVYIYNILAAISRELYYYTVYRILYILY